MKRSKATQLMRLMLANIDRQTGHRITLGGMHNGRAAVNNMQRQRFVLGRIYEAAFTAARVATRFEIPGLGAGGTDRTTNLVEEWDTENATGSSSLPRYRAPTTAQSRAGLS